VGFGLIVNRSALSAGPCNTYCCGSRGRATACAGCMR